MIDYHKLVNSEYLHYYNRRAVRAAKRARKSRLLSEFLPNWISSAFLAMDPFQDYELSPTPISPTNRTASYASLPISRRIKRNVRSVSKGMWSGSIPGQPFAVAPYYLESETKSDLATLNQVSLKTGRRRDTSKRTRPIGYERGEFDMFRTRSHSPSRRNFWVSQIATSQNVNPGGNFQFVNQTDYNDYRVTGSGARLTQNVIDSIESYLVGDSIIKFNKHGSSLLSDARANARYFDGIRELGELRDLPRLIRDSARSIVDLVDSGRISLSSVFLSKEFGWDPLVKSTLDLVSLPEKIAKQVNYLISRSDKLTTFHSKRKGIDGVAAPTGFAYDALPDESLPVLSHQATNAWEVRTSVNFLVKFPKLEVPVLKSRLKDELWGLRFRVTDFYNLVPWTWLTDWFTGLGDYLNLIESVVTDDSLVNWATMTYSSEYDLVSTYSYSLKTRNVLYDTGVKIIDYTESFPRNHSSLLRSNFQIRRDVGNLTGLLRQTWLPQSLSEFQAAILGSLLLQRY